MSDVRMTVVMPSEFDAKLTELASNKSTSKTEIIRRALALYMVATEAQNKGQNVALVDEKNSVLKQVVGI